MRRLLPALLACVLAPAVTLPACAAQPAPAATFQPAQLKGFQRSTLTIERRDGRDSFQVWLALTPAEQQQGLMWIRQLPADYGMLFLYEPPQFITMWMKNTFVSLDMLFFDEDGRIIRVAERTTPQSEALVDSGGRALGVLELAAGEAARRGIRVGDRIVHAGIGPGR